jgi:hypothetical protein
VLFNGDDGLISFELKNEEVTYVQELLLDLLALLRNGPSQKLLELEIENCRTDQPEALAIFTAKKLMVLNVTSVIIGIKELETICRPIMNSETLVRFGFDDVSASNFPSNSGSIFSEIMRTNASLLSMRWKVDQRQHQIPRGMFKSYFSTSIVNLNLSFSYIIDVDDFCELIRSNQSLIYLNLAGIKTDDESGPSQIFAALEENRTIETLRIAYLEMNPSSLTDFEKYLMNTKCLTSLSFGPSFSHFRSNFAQLLMDSGFSSFLKMEKLKKVSFAGKNLTLSPLHLTAVLNLKDLEHLSVTKLFLPSSCLEGLSLIFKDQSSLIELHLERCQWEDEGNIVQLLEMLNKTVISLVSLKVGRVSDSSAVQIFKLLKENKSLLQFALENTSDKPFDEAFNGLVELIADNSVMQHLSVGKFKSRDTFQELEDALQRNTPLLNLNLQPKLSSSKSLQRNRESYWNNREISTLFSLRQYPVINHLDKYIVKLIFEMGK